MIDFNTKRSILKRLRKKREDNKLLWLPCVIAELFVKLWYNIACTVDMALSDSRGNFLGVKQPIEQKRRRRQDDIVHVKKPFLGRIVSAFLAVCFMTMIVPITELSVFAAETYIKETELIIGQCVDDTNSYYFKRTEYSAANNATVSELKAVFANGCAQLTWKAPSGFESNRSCTYLVGYTTNKSADVTVSDNYSGTTMIIEELADDTFYEFYVIPRISLNTYEQAYTEDLAGNKVPVYDPDDPTIKMYYQKGNKRVEGNKSSASSGQPNGKITPPVSLSTIEYDESRGEVVLTWPHTSIVNLTGHKPYGYVVYRCTMDFSSSNSTEKYELVNSFSADSHNPSNDGVTIEYRDGSIQYGRVYKYYVKAYDNLFGGTQYIEDEPGIVTSGDHTVTTGKLVVSIPPAKVLDMQVISNKKDTLDVSWEKPRNSNVDGYFLFRSEEQYTTAYIESITVKDANGNDVLDANGNPKRKYWNEETETYNYYDFIMDMVEAGNAKQLTPTGTKYEDKYSNRNQLENDTIYYYYVIPYVDADKTGFKKLYGPMSSNFGAIDAALSAPQWDSVSTEDGKVTLKWKSVDGADGYKIYITKTKNYTGSSTGLGDMGFIDVGKVTSYTIESLLNGDQYSYTIQAYTNVATSTDDRLVSTLSDKRVITVGIELGPPQDLKVVTKDGENTVSWTTVNGADGYVLYYTCNNGPEKTVELTKATFNHTKLNNDDLYTYYVKAYKTIDKSYDENNGGKEQVVYSEPSVVVSIIVGDKLDAPKDFTGISSDGRIDLSWTASKGAEGYIIYASCGGRHEEFDVSKVKYEHIGLNNGDIWSYYIVAYKTVNGERVFSDRSNIIILTVGDFLETPKDFTAVTTDGKVDLSWTAAEGAEGYILYAYSGSKSYQFDVSKVKYEHIGLKNGDTWTYYLVAYKTINGVKVYSNPTRSITVTIGISLNAAIDLTATAGNRQIDLSWSKVDGAEGYVIYLYNKKTMEFEPITVVSGTKYSHVGLKNGQEYTYMVAPFKTINGKRYFGEYSMAVTAIPTTGSLTDIDRTLNIKGTTPYGISHSEYISAKANHDAFDESVDVYFTTNKESTAAVKDIMKTYAEGLKSFIIYPFDISIYKENTLIEVDPNEGYSVTITMPIPDKLIAYRDYITIVHINEAADTEEISEVEWMDISPQQLEVLPCAVVDIDNVWCVQFECTSFSPYAIVIYKKHILDVSAGEGFADGSFAGSFNSGLLLFTALPDILPDNRKLKVVYGGKKRYHIKKVTKR